MEVSRPDRQNLLITEATRWLGVTEEGGDNQGQLVEIFQRAADGKSQGEPWCLAFVMHCIKAVDAQAAALGDERISPIFPTEHVLTCWNNSPKSMRIIRPVPGCLVLWNHYRSGKPTNSGHIGIVTVVYINGDLLTIEGNTGGGTALVNREGDGVFRQVRNPEKTGSAHVLGFLRPWRR